MQRALAAVLGVVQRSIGHHGMLEPGDRVLVAISGGPDSVGLLMLLCHLRRKLGIELVAAHVNHRLRGEESDADELCAAAAAEQLRVSFVRCELPKTLARGGNLEARARELRYAALHRLAARHECTKIATGHTLDDQAETVLLRLIRGTGPVGLGSIDPRRRDGVIRPLIDCAREEVEEAVRLAGLRYCIDASNEDPRFLRTHVRRRVLPLLAELNPSVRRACANLSGLVRAEREIVAQWADVQVAAVAPRGVLRLEALAALAPGLRGHVVRRWLLSQGVREDRLATRHVEALVRLAAGRRMSGVVKLPGGLVARRRGGDLVLGAAPARSPFAPQPLSPAHAVHLPGGWHLLARVLPCRWGRTALPDDLWSAVCDAQGVSEPLVVRTAERGERVRPLGLGGGRKLSDLFIDRKVPADERWVYPVVASDTEIIWVPGVVRSEALVVTERTRTGIWLEARQRPAGVKGESAHGRRKPVTQGVQASPKRR